VILVSDTSPINNLAAINQLHLLHQLYGMVFIPEAVYAEVKPLLSALVNEAGFWIAKPLYNSVLRLVDEIDSP
jgi:predicted nucleic acid-binding protein